MNRKNIVNNDLSAILVRLHGSAEYSYSYEFLLYKLCTSYITFVYSVRLHSRTYWWIVWNNILVNAPTFVELHPFWLRAEIHIVLSLIRIDSSIQVSLAHLCSEPLREYFLRLGTRENPTLAAEFGSLMRKLWQARVSGSLAPHDVRSLNDLPSTSRFQQTESLVAGVGVAR